MVLWLGPYISLFLLSHSPLYGTPCTAQATARNSEDEELDVGSVDDLVFGDSDDDFDGLGRLSPMSLALHIPWPLQRSARRDAGSGHPDHCAVFLASASL